MAVGLGGAMLAVEGVKFAFAAAQRVGQQFYGGMVAANEQLNQKILGSASNLAATARVFKEGVEIVNPTEKISELQKPLRNALKQIAEDAISLVGVTSGELTGVFAILNSQASQLTGQSKEFTNAIDAAGKLTIDFSAALGTIGLPLHQAGQEIRSILMGQIDMNSMLAKQLGITNEMVKRWKSQGALVDELRKRLQPFVDGNALAAKSIGGISSNIRDVLEIIQRNVGEPLLEPIVEGLDWIYNKLDQNRDAIEDFIRPFINQAIEFGRLMAQELAPLFDSTGASAGDLQTLLLDLFSVTTQAIVGLTKALVPVIQTIQGMLQTFGEMYERAKSIISLLPGFGDGRAAIDALADGTRLLIGEQDKLEAKYAAIAEKKRQGIALTEEEKKQEAAIKQNAASAVEAIDQRIAAYQSLSGATKAEREDINKQIAALEDLRREYEVGGAVAGVEKQIEALEAQKKAGKGNIEQIDAQIKALEAQKEALGGFGGLMPEFGLTGAEIQDLGNSFEQLARDAQGAKDQIAELMKGGDPAQMQQAANKLTDLTQKQVQMGAISREQAIEQLEIVRDNGKLEFDTRQKAADQIVALREKMAQVEALAVQRQIKDQEQAIEAGTVGQVEGARELTRLKKQELEIQLQNIKAAIEQEKALRKTQIEAQIAGLDTQIAEAQKAVAAAPNKAAALEAQKQVEALEAQKQTAQASLTIQSEKGQELAQQAQETQEQLENIEIDGNRKIQQAIEAESREKIEAIKTQQTELTTAVANGEKSRLEAAREGAQLRQQELAVELSAIDQQIAEEQKLRQGSDPTVREKELMAERRQLVAQQKQAVVDAEKSLRDAQLKEMQETQDRLMDQISQGAAERQLALQKEINANPGMTREDRAERELAIQRETLEAEYQAEVENLRRLQALPLPRDPTERADAENKIRDAILKTTNMSVELARMEEREQRAAIDRRIADIDRGTTARLNAIESERLSLELMLQSHQQITNQMEAQLDLINEQIQARNQYDQTTQSYYSIAAKFAKSEKERSELEQEAARVKISQLRQAHRLEELQLKLKHLQTAAMLEQEIIQGRINQAQSRANAAQSRADYAKAAADPTTTPEQLEAQALGVEAADMQVAAADFQFSSAVRNRRNFEITRQVEMEQLEDRQSYESFEAEAELAELTPDERDDRRIANQSRNRARNRERNRRRGTGIYSNGIDEMSDNVEGFYEDLPDPFGVPAQQAQPARPGRSQNISYISVQPVPSTPPAAGLIPVAMPGMAGQAPVQGATENKVVNFNPTFNNNFNGTGKPDKDAVKDFENASLGVLKKVLDLV
jgi:hypothetical protein